MLTRSKYAVDIAEDGQMLVKKWEMGKYDLVLMDIQMPQHDGFQATNIIREKEREFGGHTQIHHDGPCKQRIRREMPKRRYGCLYFQTD